MKVKNNLGEIEETEFEAFNFWECGYIGLNVKYSDKPGLLAMYDLRPEEAQKLIDDLSLALYRYKKFEEEIKGMEC